MTVIWTKAAEQSFQNEIEFILDKWNTAQVQKFINLVENQINTLSNQPYLGRDIGYKSFKKLVLSKQTTLFYRLLDANQIEISFFWNNKMDLEKIKILLE